MADLSRLGSFLGRNQPTIGFLVLDRPPLGGVDLVSGVVEDLRAHQADHATVDGIDSNGRTLTDSS
jgi:hypothetical protein